MASIRRELRIGRPAAEVWDLITHPGTIQQWFPGIVEATVDTVDGTTTRTITTGTGGHLVEEVVTNDPIARRFQYSIAGGVFRSHLATIDVIALSDDECLTIYSTDAMPDVMALVLGGATGAALEGIRDLAIERAAAAARSNDSTTADTTEAPR